jgi:hypothetical protein
LPFWPLLRLGVSLPLLYLFLTCHLPAILLLFLSKIILPSTICNYLHVHA